MSNLTKRIIGLTGGISTGKTTVSNYLHQKYQIPILDADIYAREAVKLNSPILQKIINRYGAKVVNSNGELNRAVLGEIVFNNSDEKKWVENQIHPFVYDCFVKNLKSLNKEIICLVIPLLFEADFTNLVTEIWVVSCQYLTQINRLKIRNSLTEKQAIARIKNQLPLSEKEALADIVLDNNYGLENLYRQIDNAIKN